MPTQTKTLRILVADDDPRTLQFYDKVLTGFGHHVIAQATTGQQLVEQCLQLEPDLVITDIRMPVLDGLQAALEIRKSCPTPIIIVSAYHDADLVERAMEDHVLAYLVKPIKRTDLEPAIALAMRRFHEFQALHKQASDLRQALEDRKLVERAKGILMSRGGLSEPEAFSRLQEISCHENKKMVEIARSIVLAETAFRPVES